jgi:hypothetical protein
VNLAVSSIFRNTLPGAVFYNPDFSCKSHVGFHSRFAHEKSELEPGFGLSNQVDDQVGLLCGQESLTQRRIAKQAANTGEDLEMLCDIGGDEQKEQPNRPMINRAIWDADGMPADDDGGMFDQSSEGRAGMGQGDPVTDARAMKFLTVLECAQQGLTPFRAISQFRHGLDQLSEDLIAMLSRQMQLDSVGRDQVRDG